MIQLLLQEIFSPTQKDISADSVHHKRNYFIIPCNKLGQDIFIRATEIRELSSVVMMPSGDMKPLKVPVSKNMLNSHLRGNIDQKIYTMVTLIIAEAHVCSLYHPVHMIQNFTIYLSCFVKVALLSFYLGSMLTV